MSFSKDYREYLVNNTGLMQNSIDLYVKTVRLFMLNYGEDFSIKNINEFITEHTNEKYSYYMRAPFKYVLMMLGKESMFGKIKSPKRFPRKKTYINVPTNIILKVIESIDDPINRLIAKIQYATGARAGDILNTKVGYISVDEKNEYTIRIIGKGGKEKYTSLKENLAKAVLLLEKRHENRMKSWDKEDQHPYIFLRSHSKDVQRAKRTCYHYYWASIKKATEKCKVDFRTHYFRHKYIQDALDAGYDVFSIQKAVGHKKIETTIRYIMEEKISKEISKKIR